MNVFAVAAGMMAVILALVAGWQRPRLAVIVSGSCAALRRLRASGGDRVLCDLDCNIRVDLVFIIPILGLATLRAYQSYMGRPGP